MLKVTTYTAVYLVGLPFVQMLIILDLRVAAVVKQLTLRKN